MNGTNTRRWTGPTLDDVAREAGVSRATVSRVINSADTVSENLVAIVQHAITVVGYVPNRPARQLVTRRSGVIALVPSIRPQSDTGDVPASNHHLFKDPFFGRIADGVLGYLTPRRLHTLLVIADCDSMRDEAVNHLRQGIADGALVVTTDSSDPLPARLVEAGLPAVFFARPGPSVPADYVDLANQDGGRLAADRLLALGRRQVALIAGPMDLQASQARIGGFCDTMARHGVGYVPVVHGNFTQESGERAMRELLLRIEDVDGVFAANDLMAVGAIHVLRESGRRIPEDVAVIGFDDSSAAVAARPQLTTVRQPVEDMAAAMARLLLERLDSPRRQPQAVLFDPELIVRASG